MFSFIKPTVVLVLLAPTLLSSQKISVVSEPPPPILMPEGRVSSSYRIYSGLIPLGETAGSAWPHELWLV